MNPTPDRIDYEEEKFDRPAGWVAYVLENNTYYRATEPCETEELALKAYKMVRARLQSIRAIAEMPEPVYEQSSDLVYH